MWGFHVATLTLGSRPKQGLAKVRAKSEVQESHFIFMEVQESVREWTPTLPNELQHWELDPRWIPKSLEGNYRGQNSLD